LTPILMVLVFILMGWFAAGTILNVRKGSAAMRWMQGGLPMLGERSTVRWLGTTSVELRIREAKPPFTEVAVVVFLEPRDVPWLWALNRSWGRRDTLIIRGLFRRTPDEELEALDRQSWSGRDAVRELGEERWSERGKSADGELSVLIKVDSAGAQADALLDLARGAGMRVRRLSVRRKEPHLVLHVDLPAVSSDAAAFFRCLRAIGERAAA
jgi:hypothetical protein